VTENPQSENSLSGETGDLDRVQAYQKIVLEYEALDEQIDTLLAKHDGATEKMSAATLAQYRDLARRRDDVYNQMKALEQQLLDNDNETE
jgi:predicted  nucleic acid-binding Zn-ribbon protein